jgi:E3 ubiquitin-protein ligase HUWE1
MQKTSSYSSMLSFSMPPNVDPVIFRAHNLLLFIQNHAGILNLIIKNKPQLLESSLDVLVKVPQLRLYLTFENKRHYFLSQLKARNKDTARRRTGPHLQVRRNTVFEDSFQNLRWRSAEDYKGKLHVQFYGEEGVDAGGLTREWFMMLSKEIFNPNYCLFTVAADGATFQPYAKSGINPDHLLYFKFVGRIIGKAICDGHLMDAHFTKSFYKHIIGIPVDFTDVEAIDPDYFKNLKQILQYSLEDIGLELTMSVEDLQFGKHTITDLVPNGRHVDVDDNNKVEYVRLVAHHRMTTAIRQQIAAFLEGFYDLVPPALISIFSPPELELLICGLPEVDLDDLFANTDYHSYQPLDKQIQWFWEIIRSLDTEKKNKFLHFVTGTSKVPLEGFKSLQGMRGIQKFNIHRVFGDTSLLPSAHTCFNQLDLPAYETKEELTEKLMLAINEGSEGFGFA